MGNESWNYAIVESNQQTYFLKRVTYCNHSLLVNVISFLFLLTSGSDQHPQSEGRGERSRECDWVSQALSPPDVSAGQTGNR